jgi:hypothetical protein
METAEDVEFYFSNIKFGNLANGSESTAVNSMENQPHRMGCAPCRPLRIDFDSHALV